MQLTLNFIYLRAGNTVVAWLSQMATAHPLQGTAF